MKHILFALLLLPFFGVGQVSMNVSGSYTQDFNSLALTGTNIAWTDNTTIPNWFCQKSTAGGVVYDASVGNSGTGKVYSFGAVSDPERSLGSVGSAAVGNVAHGILLQNTSNSVITDMNVTYTLEQWRDGGNAVPAAQQIRVYYKISSTAISALNPNVNTGWTEVVGLMTQSPINTTTAGALNGNDPLNKVTLTTIAIPGLLIASNEYIMLKWEDPNHSGNDHGLAIDDVTINWVISCNTYNTLNPVSCTNYTVPSGDETYSSSGTYMDTIPNVALCDSILTINLTITTGITYYADTDTDGFGDPLNTTVACSLPVGYVTNGDDCDDTNNSIGAASTTFYIDSDGDLYGSSATTIVACTAPPGYVANNTDCDDAVSTIHPGAIDIPDNGIDEDCVGGDASSLGSELGIYEFTAAAACPVTALSVTTQPANAVFSDYGTVNTTCSSTNNVFSNSAWNTTAVIDLGEYNEFTITANNCVSMDLNRLIFTHRISATGGTPTWFLRSSLDNYSTDLGSGMPLTTDQIDTVDLNTDFDAVTQVTFRFYIINMGVSGSTWRNDNVRLIGNFGTLTPQSVYLDSDGDTFGDPGTFISSCSVPNGYSSNNLDCDDSDAAINPNTVWFQDLDNDTYGDPAITFTGCVPPANYVLNSDDCDDTNGSLNIPLNYFADTDFDGYGSPILGSIPFCSDPGPGYSLNDLDCDDTNEEVFPGALEICDGLDNDCDFAIDEGLVFMDYFVDADNDNFGTGSAQSYCEDPGAGYATIDGDCDDSDPTSYPGGTEILNNGIDENCDGTDNYLGLDEIGLIGMNLQPNPSNGIFTVSFNTTISGKIECFDLNGKLLLTQSFNGDLININLSGLSSGTYLLKTILSEGIIQNRIVIEN